MYNAAIEFRKAVAARSYKQPDELLDAMQPVALKAKLQVFGVFYLPPVAMRFDRQRLGRSVFYHDSVPGPQFWSEYQPIATVKGSALSDYSRSRSSPFTMTEGMRKLQLTGGQRWLIDLYYRYHMRDVIYCPLRRWTVLFHSETPVELGTETRQILHCTACVAAAQMERLVTKPLSPDEVKLSPNELSALRLCALGYNNSTGAAEMAVQVSTFRTFTARAIKKLKASNLPNAIHIAHVQGLLNGN